MDPILLQKQFKENQADLESFYKELKAWGDEMKRKDQHDNKNEQKEKNYVSKKQKLSKQSDKSKTIEKPARKKGPIDYSAWDAFDVEAECAKVDYKEDEESDLTDECDENLREQAHLEKEKGNKYVKMGKWDEAIKCYTKAIDCFGFDPVFYANRALCYLKKNNMEKAESDCTMSLKLDKSYVKAYQRRAAAREALNKLEEAEIDLRKVLELEPKNKESQKALDNLKAKLEKLKKDEPKRPESKFVASRKQINKTENKEPVKMDSKTYIWPPDNEIVLLKPVNKPPHLRSKAPLKRVEIKEIDEIPQTKDQDQHLSFPKPFANSTSIKTDDLKIIEKIDKPSVVNGTKTEEKPPLILEPNQVNIEMEVPRTSVQFYFKWKNLNKNEKYIYLKHIDPNKLEAIFKESMEVEVFSEIIQTLADSFIKNGEKIYDWLLGLSKIKRFSALVMFMTPDDEKCLWKLIDYIKINENKDKEDMDLLINAYML